MMTYWTGNQTNPSSSFGLANPPYWFWEAGGLWGAMIDYWHLTGDTSYLDVMIEAIYAQASPTMDFKMPAMVAQLVGLECPTYKVREIVMADWVLLHRATTIKFFGHSPLCQPPSTNCLNRTPRTPRKRRTSGYN